MGTEAIMEEDLQRNTNHLLHRLGLTANYRGYFYVSYGIMLCAKACCWRISPAGGWTASPGRPSCWQSWRRRSGERTLSRSVRRNDGPFGTTLTSWAA